MRSPRRLAPTLAGTVLAGLGLASCVLDLAGQLDTPSGSTATTRGAGGATTTATSGGGGGGTSTAADTGGTGGAGPLCGDGVLEAGEGCDDGNLLAYDGCSPTCAPEPLDTCPGLPIALSSPGITIAGTLTGATDTVAPTCGENRKDVIYEATPTEAGTLTLTLSGGYAKSLSVRSSCMDGPNNELDCRDGTGDLSTRLWVFAGVKYHVIVDADPHLFTLQLALSKCGNGVKEGLEDCDDLSDPSCTGCVKCASPGDIQDPKTHHCYRRLPAADKKDWKAARRSCIAWGGDLVGVSSTAEANFLKAQPSFDGLWTGATDVPLECQFHWVNGEPWQPRWRSGEPNNSLGNEDCGLFFTTGEMDDRNCEEDHDALCERAPGGTCGDKIVQPGEECDDGLTYVNVACKECKIKCPDGQIEDPATRHCYQLVTNSYNWIAAAADCALKGGYLATITSPAENALILPLLTAPAWIGASSFNHPMAWVNTDAFCYVNWGAGSPSAGDDCATMELTGTWSTDACAQMQSYVCEHDT